MVDATGAGSGAGATAASASMIDAALSCPKCLAHFETKESKRSHMRCDWQWVSRIEGDAPIANEDSVYNLKRKIASLEPISEQIFDERVREVESESDETENFRTRRSTGRRRKPKSLQSEKHQPRQESPRYSPSTTDAEDSFDPTECIFCSRASPDLNDSLSHMSQSHSFFIPHLDQIIDVSSLLHYLHIVISELHECLYCGVERGSEAGIQNHMEAKGHCRVRFGGDEGDDWLGLAEFYECQDGKEKDDSEGEGRSPVFDGERLLPSGRTIAPKSSRPRRQRPASPSPSRRLLTSSADSDIPPCFPTDLRLALRRGTATSLMGIPELRQRALIATEKKMLGAETRKKNEYERKVERGGNCQKTFRVTSIGKKAGGLEKRNG